MKKLVVRGGGVLLFAAWLLFPANIQPLTWADETIIRHKSDLIQLIQSRTIHYRDEVSDQTRQRLYDFSKYIEALCGQIKQIRCTPADLQAGSPLGGDLENKSSNKYDCEAEIHIPALQMGTTLPVLDIENKALDVFRDLNVCTQKILATPPTPDDPPGGKLLGNRIILVFGDRRQSAGLILSALLDYHLYRYPEELSAAQLERLEKEFLCPIEGRTETVTGFACRKEDSLLYAIEEQSRALHDEIVFEFDAAFDRIARVEDTKILQSEVVRTVIDVLDKTRRFQQELAMLEVRTLKIAQDLHDFHASIVLANPTASMDAAEMEVEARFERLRSAIKFILGQIRFFYILDPPCPFCT